MCAVTSPRNSSTSGTAELPLIAGAQPFDDRRRHLDAGGGSFGWPRPLAPDIERNDYRAERKKMNQRFPKQFLHGCFDHFLSAVNSWAAPSISRVVHG